MWGKPKTIGTPAQEKEITEKEYQRINELINSGEDFAIDDTNLRKDFRKTLIDFIRNHRGLRTIVGVRINTSLEVCKNRRRGQIPTYIVKNMWDKVQEVDPSEFDAFIEEKGE